ncbi:phosphate uptake regulator PhoU [Candidatus Bathyarchaeota archaeon]|nr:phosphate uptake regulator PhoU [Candidatus Bathyarchaeota archaeon]MCK4482446.1 phosphate uptake regulator PhoU [Candidatus Bathyarchaeota archaeon]
MERKIISLGRSSLVVSLPKHWVKLNELKQGDVVSLAVQRDRSLAIFPSVKKKKGNEEIVLHVDADEKVTVIARRIIGSYLNGYTRIKVLSDEIFSVRQRKEIRNIVRMLYMRVMEADSKSMSIQTLIDETKASLELAIQRMHLICHSMCRDILDSLKRRDVILAKSVFSLDDDVDHFSFFLLRLLRDAARDSILANQLDIDPLDCMDYQTLVYRVEHTADHATNIARQLIILDGSRLKIPDELLALLFSAGTEAVDLYSKALAAFFSKNVADSVAIMDQEEKIEELDREIASKTFMTRQKNALMVCMVCSIRGSIKGIAECAMNIAETAINRAYKMAI